MLQSKGIITNLQREIIENFIKLKESNEFYLTGGTALSDFFLAHRRSFDLDIFTREKELILPFSYILEEEFKKNFDIKILRRHETFLNYQIKKGRDETRIHIALDCPYRFENPKDSNLGIKVNNYKDLIVDKLLTFFGRAEYRDAVDLFFILKENDFWQLANLAKEKDPGFDLYWLAISLNKVKEFPERIEDWFVEMIREVSVEDIKNLFSSLAKEIMNKIKFGGLYDTP